MCEKYRDLNDCYLTEKLREVKQSSISRESVRRIRVGMGKAAKRKRKAPRHRARRLREASEGSLVQIDGSPHNWFGEDRPPATLVGGIDDATGKVLSATFRPHEDLHGYATIFDQIFENYGLPVSFYGDGTSILVRNDDNWSFEEELRGKQFPTQMGQVLIDLGIGYIRAGSSQAKGRIESLWGTFQDRLTAELTLRGITAIDEANAFLSQFIEDYNRRFAREAPFWRKPKPGWINILSCRYSRKVARDNPVQLPAVRNEDKHRLLPGQTRAESIPTRVIMIPPGPGGRSTTTGTAPRTMTHWNRRRCWKVAVASTEGRRSNQQKNRQLARHADVGADVDQGATATPPQTIRHLSRRWRAKVGVA